MRIVIADDEQPARDKLKRQLQQCPDIELVAEAENGQQAVELINKLQPDVALLDINMPLINGMEIKAKLEQNCHIIFTTAYDKFAVQAFEQAAVDYLLKPFSLARLQKALSRVEDKLGEEKSRDLETADLTINSKISGRTRLIQLENIRVIKAELTGTVAYATLEKSDVDVINAPVNQSLDELMSFLPQHFLRIHRKTIINTKHIVEVRKWQNSNLLILLKNTSTPVTTSRSGTRKLKEFLNL